jgi:DNA (cytosine-5)-methyltransferase 1
VTEQPSLGTGFTSCFGCQGTEPRILSASHAPTQCARTVGRCALQVFKRADRAPWGRYRIQYVFRCPNVKCRNQVVEPSFRAAAEIIDRELLGQRIGDRSKPLAEKILARIRAGIERYWAPLLVPVEGRDGKQASPVSDPLRTMTTPNETGLLVPTGGTSRTDATTTDQPMPTRTTRENDGLAVPPFIAELRGGGSTHRPVTEPLATVTASGTHHGLVMAFYGRGGGQAPPPANHPPPPRGTDPPKGRTKTPHQLFLGGFRI